MTFDRDPQEHPVIQEILEHLEWTDFLENVVQGDIKLVINCCFCIDLRACDQSHKPYQNTKFSPTLLNPVCILYKGHILIYNTLTNWHATTKHIAAVI